MKLTKEMLEQAASKFQYAIRIAGDKNRPLTERRQAAARAVLFHEKLPRTNGRAYEERNALLKAVLDELP